MYKVDIDIYGVNTRQVNEVIRTIETANLEQIKEFAHEGFDICNKATLQGIWGRTMMVACDARRTGEWYNVRNMVVILCKPYPKGFPMLEHSVWSTLRATVIQDLKEHSRLRENDLNVLMEPYIKVFGKPKWMGVL